MVGRHCSITRITRDVARADDAFATKRGFEDGRVPRCAECLERLARRAGQGAQAEGFAFRADDVVEERAEFRAAQLGGRVGHRLQ